MQPYTPPKPMKKVGDLFERYKKRFIAPQASVEKLCSEVIKEITGFEISADKISYTVSSKTLSLNVPSILKSELKFHHSKILETMKEKLGERGSPKNIF